MTTPSWQYDEMKQAGTDYEADEEIRIYDERMSRLRDIESETAAIIETLGIEKSSVVLEFGTGTGSFAAAVSPHCRQVYAVDISAPMLAFAGKKAASKGCENIEFIRGGFLTYTHQGPAPDFVITQLALHHLPDFWKLIALKKIHDDLAPGGKLFLKDVVFSLQLEKYEKTIDYTIQAMEAAAGSDTGANFIRHIQQEYSTFDWVMEEMLYRAGFIIEQADYGELFLTTYVCTKDQTR
jgi:ubiquinone/menaquinone biosynthesis C-methylase UbiE